MAQALRVANDAGRISALMAPFFEFEVGNRGYSSNQQWTKGYKLRPNVREAIHEMLRDPDAPVQALVDTGSGLEPAQELPGNTVPDGFTRPA